MSGKIDLRARLKELPRLMVLIPAFVILMASSAFATFHWMGSGDGDIPDPEIIEVTRYVDAFGRECDEDGVCEGPDGQIWLMEENEDGTKTFTSASGLTCVSEQGANVERCTDASNDRWFCALNTHENRHECLRDDGSRVCEVNDGRLECRTPKAGGLVEICLATEVMHMERCRTVSDEASGGDGGSSGTDGGSEVVEQICMWGSNSSYRICGVDGQPPVLGAQPLMVGVHYSTILPTAGSVFVTISANKAVQVPSGWQRVSEKVVAKVFEANGTEVVRIGTGSETAEARVVVNNINRDLATEVDTEPPQVLVSYSTTAPTNGNVVVTLRANKEVRLVEGWTRISAILLNEMTRTFTANGTETVRVADLSGNVTEVQVAVNNIDRAAPVVSNLRYSTTDPTRSDVVVTFETNKDVQTPNGWERDGSARRFRKVFTANGGETVRVVDLAGNAATVTVSVGNIDREPLNITVVRVEPFYNSANGLLQSVTMTIDVSKPNNRLVGGLDGWTRLSDRMYSRTFSADFDEIVTATDWVGITANYRLVVRIAGTNGGNWSERVPVLVRQ